MQNDFTVVRGATIKKILSRKSHSIYDLIKRVYLAHEDGNTVVPESSFLYFPENTRARIISLPAYISMDGKTAGIKWISSNPQNLTKGLPRASAVIILNSVDTGIPYACLEGSLISAARTAISAVLAAEHMHCNRKQIPNLGIVGNGPIAYEIYKCFIDTGWDIKQLTLFDINPESSRSFVSKVNVFKQSGICIAYSIEKLIVSCDTIVFATTTSTPYLHNLNLIKHNPLILNISLRDMSSKLIANSYNVVDDISHVLNANTSLHLAQQEYNNIAFICGTLGGLMQNKYKLDIDKPRIFSPMGLGVLDIALAKYIFSEALGRDDKITINNFI